MEKHQGRWRIARETEDPASESERSDPAPASASLSEI
jgi:hypothetical protein